MPSVSIMAGTLRVQLTSGSTQGAREHALIWPAILTLFALRASCEYCLLAHTNENRRAYSALRNPFNIVRIKPNQVPFSSLEIFGSYAPEVSKVVKRRSAAVSARYLRQFSQITISHAKQYRACSLPAIGMGFQETIARSPKVYKTFKQRT